MTDIDLDTLRDLVARLDWRFAKTMPEAPHWYIVRDPSNEALYVKLFAAVKQHGTLAWYQPPGRGRGYQQRYLKLRDGFKYWVMCADVKDSRVINRARVD